MPVTLVLDVNTALTDSSVRTLSDKATSNGRMLTLLKVVAPIVLLVLGLVFLAVGALRRRGPEPTSTPSRQPTAAAR